MTTKPVCVCATLNILPPHRAPLFVQSSEYIGGQRGKVLVRQVVGHLNPLDNGSTQLDALRWRKLLNFRQDMGNGLGHD